PRPPAFTSRISCVSSTRRTGVRRRQSRTAWGAVNRTSSARAIPTPGVRGRKHPDGHMSDPIVSTSELTRVYGEGETAVHALRGVTTGFPSGQFAAIMGPSGSGKSTLMHLLAGLDKPSSGSVIVDGNELAHLDDKGLTRLRRDRLGFVFQAFNLVPVLTAEENIVLPLTLAGKKPDKEWHDTLIAAVGLGDRLTHRP